METWGAYLNNQRTRKLYSTIGLGGQLEISFLN